jgi:twitching motility protein PilT
LARRARLVHEDELATILRGLPLDADLGDVLRRFADSALGQDFPRIQRLAQVARERARSGAPAPKLPGRLRPTVEPLPLPLFRDLPPSATLDAETAATLMCELLASARQEQASSVHITAGNRPTWRRYGELRPLAPAALEAPTALALVSALLGPDLLHELSQGRDVSGAIDLPDGTRSRVSVAVHRAGIDGTFHLIPVDPCPLERLGFNPSTAIERLLDCHNGLVLITGPAGSGKTSTLTALIALLSEKRMAHIITIEDPIEIIHPRRNSMISQRQLGRDTQSHAAALRAALREDPDVIVVGDMHDLATTELAPDGRRDRPPRADHHEYRRRGQRPQSRPQHLPPQPGQSGPHHGRREPPRHRRPAPAPRRGRHPRPGLGAAAERPGRRQPDPRRPHLPH